MSGLDPSWSVPESPPFAKLFTAKVLLSVATSFIFFRWASSMVKEHCWKEYKGFKQYRLHNLSICLLHSFICGSWVFVFAITHVEIMLTDPVFYFKPYMKIVILITIGYLFHDTYDMLQYEVSKWTIELLLHHFATGFVMSVAVCGEKFTVYAYCLQSISIYPNYFRIFLHIRTLSQLSGANESHPNLFRLIKFLNISTFVIFRFGVQLWETHFVLIWRQHFHFFYFACGFFGGLLFLITNTLLFMRILAADNILCSVFKRHLAINRDEQKLVKES